MPTANAVEAARSLGLGRAAFALYHRPVGFVRKSIAEGGPWQQHRTEIGRRAMVSAAERLPPFAMPEMDGGARVTFLSGDKYWYQTLFCFASLQSHSAERITPVIVDDGTLVADVRQLIRRVVPWAEFVALDVVEACLDRQLPVSRYPSLRARRREYAHLRKLIDIHLGAPGWTLVLDSDMLFFRRPDAVLDWFRDSRPIFMQDIGTMYGYSQALMEELAGGPVPARVNVGLYALHGPSIDWDRVEFWCRSQIEREGPHYLQEQGLTALLLAGGQAKPLSTIDYVVMPSLGEGRSATAVLHHYVAQSKRSYFQHGWRHVAARLAAISSDH